MKKLLLPILALGCSALQLSAQSLAPITIGTPLSEPYGVALGTNLIFFTDSANDRVLQYDTLSSALTTIVDSLNTPLSDPQGLVLAPSGLLTIADTANNRIVTVDPNSGTVTVLAGSTSAGNVSGTNGLNARFNAPNSLAVDAAGNLYVADTLNNAIKLIDNTVTNGVSSLATGFNRPQAVALGDFTGGAQQVWVADTLNDQIDLLMVTNGVLSSNVVVAGQFRVTGSADSLNAATASFNKPLGLLWIGGNTGLLIADSGNNSIRKLSKNGSGWSVATYLGATNSLNLPATMAVDADGAIVLADVKNNLLKKIVRPALPTPAMQIDSVTTTGGTFNNSVTLAFAFTTPNPPAATFRFTTDGTPPTQYAPSGASTVLTGGTGNGTVAALQVKAYSPDFGASTITSNNFNFVVADPVLNPVATNYFNPVTFTVTNLTVGAHLYWSNDGSDPTNGGPNAVSTLGGAGLGTITMTDKGAGVLKVKAFRSGFVSSQTASASYNLTCDPATITPAGLTTNNAVDVTISTRTSGGDIAYTINSTNLTHATDSTTFSLAVDGTLSAVVTHAGFFDAAAQNAVFHLFVSDPTNSPLAAVNNNDVSLTFGSATASAQLYWATNHSPTSADTLLAANGNIVISNNGPFLVKGYRNNFTSSGVVSNFVNLICGTPAISPNGVTLTNNAVTVTLSDVTTNSVLYYSTDAWVHTNTLSVGTALSGTITVSNGVLQVFAAKPGYLSSPITTATFNVVASNPTVSAPSGAGLIYTNFVTTSFSSTTIGALFNSTLNLSLPATNGGTGTLTSTYVTTTTNIAVANHDGYISSGYVTNVYVIKVAAPTVTPAGGYFPNGVSVSFADTYTNAAGAGPAICYTTNGVEPTSADAAYSGSPIALSETSYSRLLVKAFAANTLASDTVSVQSTATNSAGPGTSFVGFTRDVSAGIGATAIVPVVVDVASNQTLKSVQFRIEFAPISASVHALGTPSPVSSVSTNDFVPVAANSDGTTLYASLAGYTYSSPTGTVQGLTYITYPTNSLNVKGTVAVLTEIKVPIPTTAVVGDQYSMSVLQVSGTSDGAQTSIPMAAFPAATLLVTNIPYLVGDSSPARWYNAGDFGDGNLDNADVNTAFLATLGVHTPTPGTDAFDALDAAPPDSAGSVGGDGFLKILDWTIIQGRSLRLPAYPDNWMRARAVGGDKTNWQVNLPQVNVVSPTQPKPSKPHKLTVAPGNVWFRQAQVFAGSVGYANPGNSVLIPISLVVGSGYNVGTFQFRASLQAPAGAPAITQPLTFISTVGSSPIIQNYETDVLCAWPLLGNSLGAGLVGSNLVGYVQCQIPVGAPTGKTYVLRLSYSDGARDINTQYDLESFSGGATILAPAQTPTSVTSDDWKIKFFGSVDNPAAADNVDADGDGATNLQEYLAGTNPSDANSRLHLNAPSVTTVNSVRGVNLSWLTAPGKSYLVQSSASLTGPWTTVSTASGDGNVAQVRVSGGAASSQFYRLQLQ